MINKSWHHIQRIFLWLSIAQLSVSLIEIVFYLECLIIINNKPFFSVVFSNCSTNIQHILQRKYVKCKRKLSKETIAPHRIQTIIKFSELHQMSYFTTERGAKLQSNIAFRTHFITYFLFMDLKKKVIQTKIYASKLRNHINFKNYWISENLDKTCISSFGIQL